MKNELVKEKGGQRYDEMNLIEFPTGILAERVPIDPETGREHTQLRFARPVEEGGEQKEQVWTVTGDPNYGGLPRGYDLDVLTALLTLWSKGNFQSQLLSVGSAYNLLKMTGRGVNSRDYKRFFQAIDRLFGASIQTRYAVYDPSERRRWPVFKFKVLNSVRLRSDDPESVPRGYVRLDATLLHGSVW